MKIVVIGHAMPSLTHQRAKRFAQWLKAEGMLIDTALSSNEAYEFSGYQTALERLNEPQTIPNFPVLLVNDTLFTKRWTGGWRILFKRLQKTALRGGVVYGDIRRLNAEYSYASSWFFYCPDSSALEHLRNALLQTKNQAELHWPNENVWLTGYVDSFLHPNSPWRGFVGPRDADSLHRKSETIRWEHTLSENLGDRVQPFPRSLSSSALCVWWVDRCLHRFHGNNWKRLLCSWKN